MESPLYLNEMKKLVTQKNYPCVAAIKSFHSQEYDVGIYRNFGQGISGKCLRKDLEKFLETLKVSKSPYYTFWAIFPDENYKKSEEAFEKDLWNELSHMTSEELKESDWRGANADPNDKNFVFICLVKIFS